MQLIESISGLMSNLLARVAIASMNLSLNKFRLILFVLAAWATVALPALADTGGINPVSSDTIGAAIVNVCNTVLTPIGYVAIFVVVLYVAIQLITSAHNPEKRAKVLESLWYVLIGGLLLGGAMAFSGLIVTAAGLVSNSATPS